MNIHEAIQADDLELVKELIRADPELLESKDSGGLTPLLSVCVDYPDYGGWCYETAEFLVEVGADIEAKTPWGATPLMAASNHIRHYDSEEQSLTVGELEALLVNKGASVNAPDCGGVTPLHIAAAHDDCGLTELLLNHGANPNAQITGVETLYDGRLILLDNHCGVAATIGSTPLHLTASKNIARQLVDHGADRQIKNCDGKRPSETTPDPDVRKFLKGGGDMGRENSGSRKQK